MKADNPRQPHVRREDPAQRCVSLDAPQKLHGTFKKSADPATCDYCGQRLIPHPISGGYQTDEIIIEEEPY